jgi:hypothetical protein
MKLMSKLLTQKQWDSLDFIQQAEYSADGYTVEFGKWEPWLWYPEVWPTKSKFFTWLRGSLRNAVWNRSPIKIIFKNESCSAPPAGYEGRAKSGAYCSLSGVWEGKSKLEVDHIAGNVPINNEDEILEFLKHLIPAPNTLQLVTKEAHKVKSYAEKQGITYKQATAEKKAIEIIKSKSDKEWLEARGIVPGSSTAKRREQIVKELS